MKELGLTPFGERIVNGLQDERWKEAMKVLNLSHLSFVSLASLSLS